MKKKKFSKNRMQQEIDKSVKVKSKRNYIFVFVGIIIFTMVFSILAIKLGNIDTKEETEKLEYAGFEFSVNGNLLVSKINGIDYGFEYAPKEVEDLESIPLKSESFNSKIYLLYDPIEYNENDFEFIRLKQFLLSKGVNINFACTNEEGCGDLPIIDCRNTNKAVYLKTSNKNEIYTEENCIVLSAVKGEELKVVNRFIYGILGVIDGS